MEMYFKTYNLTAEIPSFECSACHGTIQGNADKYLLCPLCGRTVTEGVHSITTVPDAEKIEILMRQRDAIDEQIRTTPSIIKEEVLPMPKRPDLEPEPEEVPVETPSEDTIPSEPDAGEGGTGK